MPKISPTCLDGHMDLQMRRLSMFCYMSQSTNHERPCQISGNGGLLNCNNIVDFSVKVCRFLLKYSMVLLSVVFQVMLKQGCFVILQCFIFNPYTRPSCLCLEWIAYCLGIEKVCTYVVLGHGICMFARYMTVAFLPAGPRCFIAVFITCRDFRWKIVMMYYLS